MSISNTLYNVLFKRNSVMVTGIFATAFAFNLSFDSVTSKWWDNHNKGKLWKDIRHKYVTEEDEE